MRLKTNLHLQTQLGLEDMFPKLQPTPLISKTLQNGHFLKQGDIPQIPRVLPKTKLMTRGLLSENKLSLARSHLVLHILAQQVGIMLLKLAHSEI
jgi:hypothetical protein